MKKKVKSKKNELSCMSFRSILDDELKDAEMRIVFDEMRAKKLIAEAVRFARIKAGMTQNELAKAIKSKQSLVGRIESLKDTRIPSLSLLSKIVSACNGKLNVVISFK